MRSLLGGCGLLAASAVQAAQFTVSVVDADGQPVEGFKYTVQKDTTFAVDPANPPTRDEMLTFGFHASNHPPALTINGASANGNSDGSSAQITDLDTGRYYVSVLPYSGYSLSGAPVTLGGGSDSAVTVTVAAHSIPTAQIAIQLFEDYSWLNNALDAPVEEASAVDWRQFTVVLEEPAGRYGANGGPLLQDAFGNPLGTDYQPLGCNYAAGGCTVTLGDGTLHPDASGYLLVKNLAPGKYGVIVNPPVANPQWIQVTTIEGTKVIDAWVKANEPPFFAEFGVPMPHIVMGFIQPFNELPTPGDDPVATVQGTVRDTHFSRPPDGASFPGRLFPNCIVALTDAAGGPTLVAESCDANSHFSIENVPGGTYILTIWDANLDMIIAFQTVIVQQDGTCSGATGCDFGDIPVNNWFARLNTAIFSDTNQNGFWDSGEGPVGPEAGPVSIRWRDGTVYQGFPTDTEGLAPFDEIFPFFHWLVAEVGFSNKKATGATFVVDAGGQIADLNNTEFPDYGELVPQLQNVPACGVGTTTDCTYDGGNSRTETGPVLTQAFQAFAGLNNVLQFGKAEYMDYDRTGAPPDWTFVGENGGISGIVHYATTRAENDPRNAVGETWEPGIPRVQVALYANGDVNCPPLNVFPGDPCDIDWNDNGIQEPNSDLAGEFTDINNDGFYTLADVDNYPFGWADGGAKGPEDEDRATDVNGGTTGTFDYGDALQVTWTDSWDDSLPTGCGGDNALVITGDEAADAVRCFDGFRNGNQVRPGVFDGGYAFSDYDLSRLPQTVAAKLVVFYTGIRNRNSGALGEILPETWMLPADYIVEAATPPGYKLVKEEHKNVDFGDDYIPSPQALDPVCVGEPREVPPLLAFATKDGSGESAQLIDAYDAADVAAPFAGDPRPLCDRKAVPLSAAQNAAANFFVMTDVPIVANGSGLVNNDLANAFDPNAPTFGEKYSPPYVPIGFYDWNGNLVNRVYSDQFGRYNAVLPSTYSVNLPMPSGVSPNMLQTCINDAGPIANPDPTGPAFIIDPLFDPRLTQACYTLQFMPGTITYLDTPVLPIAAFTVPPTFPPDCEREDRTPMIASVNRRNNSGGGGPFALAGQQIRIGSMGGAVEVPNPDWDGADTTPRTTTRNYNFGGQQGQAWLEDAGGARTALPIVNWNGTRIFAQVPNDTPPGDYQVIVTRTGGVPAPVDSPIGVTLTVGVNVGGTEHGVRANADGSDGYDAEELYSVLAVDAGGSIQAAIDAAAPGDLILVGPGTYNEQLILWKPVKLQGWGAGAVILQARQVPTESLNAWRTKAQELVTSGGITPLPGQAAPWFTSEEGAGIFVAGLSDVVVEGEHFSDPANRGARIDGLTILGAGSGGGIVLNGYASYMNIGNNRIESNSGVYGGGVRLGHPTLTHDDGGVLVYDDADNDFVRIHHNHIQMNGGTSDLGVGGAISLNTGATGYRVQKNWACGNFTQGSGAGIGHRGFSDNGLIEDNAIVFNESFSQDSPQHGGGIFIGGQPALQAVDGILVSPGSGTVTVDANLIRGNLAGAGDGGGIRIQSVNGEDVLAGLGDSQPWDDVLVLNNMITNNVAGLAGGGVSIQDAVSVAIWHNTIANNDSVSTTFQAGTPGNTLVNSDPHPAGIVSHAHGLDFGLLMADAAASVPGNWLTFSDPALVSNIVSQNRSWFWLNADDPATVGTEAGILIPENCHPAYCDPAVELVEDYSWDLEVLPEGTGLLSPRRSLLTPSVRNSGYIGSFGNITGDPAFVLGYLNGPRDAVNFPAGVTPQTAGAFDEGGNFIQVTYGPLTLDAYDYHITASSIAIDAGRPNVPDILSLDFDNDARPSGVRADIGADERP